MADNVVNEEALRYLIDKDLKPSFDYRDVWKAEHNNAFTVAKMLNLDLLADVQTMVADALEQGQTFEQFKATLKPLLVKEGMVGRAGNGRPANPRNQTCAAWQQWPNKNHLQNQYAHGSRGWSVGTSATY